MGSYEPIGITDDCLSLYDKLLSNGREGHDVIRLGKPSVCVLIGERSGLLSSPAELRFL